VTARRPFPATVPVALALAALIGCGRGIERVSVAGAVSLDGQPLAEGSISFVPLAGGPSAGCQISGGRFSIPRAQGPGPGRYRVEIVAFEETGRQVEDDDVPGATQTLTRQVIPPRYNERSTLEVELGRDGANALEFAIARDAS
jgi:hypothetical protein